MRARILASMVDEQHRKWWTLVAVSFGLFMIMLDNTVVNVALPTIQDDLNLRMSELEWVVNGYALRSAPSCSPAASSRTCLAGGGSSSSASSSSRRRRSPAASGEGGRADRRPRRSGRRRRADESRDALDHHRDVPAAAARHGDRHLGRRLGDGARDRPARRRSASPSSSAGAGSSSSTSRSVCSGSSRRTCDRRVARHLAGAAARLARARHLGDRPLRAHATR